MKYKLILKDPKTQPAQGVYSDWKPQIAEECFRQCVYCCIDEQHWGGIDHYHIDHYRPKSLFQNLENDICNLFYACPVCNRFKSDDWPAEPDLSIPSYPDPSVTDYDSIFSFDNNYSIVGKNVSATYVIGRLYLNRPQLIYERRENSLKDQEVTLFNEVAQLASKVKDSDLASKTFKAIASIRNHLAAREKIAPYKLAEIRKP